MQFSLCSVTVRIVHISVVTAIVYSLPRGLLYTCMEGDSFIVAI